MGYTVHDRRVLEQHWVTRVFAVTVIDNFQGNRQSVSAHLISRQFASVSFIKKFKWLWFLSEEY